MKGRPNVVLPSVRDADARARLVERREVVGDLLPRRQLAVRARLEANDGCGRGNARCERTSGERRSLPLEKAAPREARRTDGAFATSVDSGGRSVPPS